MVLSCIKSHHKVFELTCIKNHHKFLFWLFCPDCNFVCPDCNFDQKVNFLKKKSSKVEQIISVRILTALNSNFLLLHLSMYYASNCLPAVIIVLFCWSTSVYFSNIPQLDFPLPVQLANTLSLHP